MCLEVTAWGSKSGKMDLCCFVFMPMSSVYLYMKEVLNEDPVGGSNSS